MRSLHFLRYLLMRKTTKQLSPQTRFIPGNTSGKYEEAAGQLHTWGRACSALTKLLYSRVSRSGDRYGKRGCSQGKAKSTRRDVPAAAPPGRARPAALHRPPTPPEPQRPPSPPAATAAAVLPKPSAPHSPGTHGSHPSPGQRPGSPSPCGTEDARPPPRRDRPPARRPHRAHPAGPRAFGGARARPTNGPAERRPCCTLGGTPACPRGLPGNAVQRQSDGRTNFIARAPAPASRGHSPTDNDNKRCCCCA